MKKRTIAITKIQIAKQRDLDLNILAPEDGIKIKGGASPWLERP